jgi:hypothetical protein
VARDQFAGHSQGWNDVAAGTAAGDENAYFRQAYSFQGGLLSGCELGASCFTLDRRKNAMSPTDPIAN